MPDDVCDRCARATATPSWVAAGGLAAVYRTETAALTPTAPAHAATGADCPRCGAATLPDARFCEGCGHDLASPAPPRAPEPAPGWVAEVWVDPDWYGAQESDDPLPSPGLVGVLGLPAGSVLLGRASRSRGVEPDVDLSSDPGISRRHARLTSDGASWWVEDLGSSNGTYVGRSTGAVPAEAIAPGERRQVGPGERIWLGAWTRLDVREVDERGLS